MLKSIDVLLGLTVVLLALSMAVTVITQSITTMFNSRGYHLRRGLVDLLQQLDPALTAELSKKVASGILTHPLVSGSTIAFGGKRLGNVIHREEFTKLLMAFAAGQGGAALDAAAQTALTAALTANGVSNPGQMLNGIRQLAVQLEKTSPELSSMARQNLAILHAAESDLVGKINNWFDQTMDRTAQRFTASTRAITFAGAIIVAFGLQVDTPALVNRLAADDQLRAQFVAEAKTLYENQKAAAADASPSAALDQKYRDLLGTTGIIRLPSSGNYWEGFKTINVLGVTVTALLLSLGAPFWYSMLGRLLQLRSILAVKDDVQRTQRQLSEPAQAGGTAASAGSAGVPAVLAGERGDLTAIG